MCSICYPPAAPGTITTNTANAPRWFRETPAALRALAEERALLEESERANGDD